jgi:hypothetical protein
MAIDMKRLQELEALAAEVRPIPQARASDALSEMLAERAEVVALLREFDRARERLLEVECPICREATPFAHASDCRLAAFL